MNTEAEFLAAIAATPDDELAYRAFGDWLEERGDPRAAWVRSREVRRWMGPTLGSPVAAILSAMRGRKDVLGARRAAEAVGEAMVPGLVELLKHEDGYVRLQAVHACRRLKKAAAAAVPALVEGLKDADDNVREQAAKAIKDCGAKKVTDTATIQAALTDENYMVREKAAGILASLGAKDATLEDLSARLGNEHVGVRRAAAEALGSLRSKAAIAPLCRALGDGDAGVREVAARWLFHHAKRGMTEPVAPLQAALRDRSARVREMVAEALGKIGPAALAASAELARATRDRSPSVREEAARALGEVAPDNDAALASLVKAAADAEPRVAAAAARAMGMWERLPAEAGAALVALCGRLEDDSWERMDVVRSLGRLERATAQVIALLRRTVREDTQDYWHESGPYLALKDLGEQASAAIPDLYEAARRGSSQAPEALGRMGPAGIARLVELLDDPGRHVPLYAVRGLLAAREAALPALPRLLRFYKGRLDDHDLIWFRREVCNAIAGMGPAAAEAIPTLLRQLNTNWGSEARKALSAMGPALVTHLPALVAVLRDPARYHTYPAIARLLSRLAAQTAEVAGPLREAIRAAAPVDGGEWDDTVRCTQETREIAARAFGSSSLRDVAHEALPELLPLLRDPCLDVRRQAAETLGAVGRPEAVPGLRAALRDADEKVRALVAVSLGRIGEASAAPDLITALRDDSARVRREAATALGKVKAAGAVDTLRQAAEGDADKAVRREASAALKKIEGRKK